MFCFWFKSMKTVRIGFYSNIFFILFIICSCHINSHPVNKAEFISKVFSQHIKCNEILNIEELYGGDSGSVVLKVVTPKKKYVAKFVKPYGTTFQEEADYANIASEIGLGPKVHYIDTFSKLIVMDFLDPDKISMQLRRSDIFYEKLAEVLLNLHKAEFPERVKKRNIIEDIDRLLTKLKEKKVSLVLLEQLSKAKESIHSALKKTVSIKERLCHCELHPGNLILHNEKFFVIDSKMAISDPCYDIATILVFWCFTKKAEQILLNFYFSGSIKQSEIERIETMKRAVMLKYAIGSLLDCSSKCKLELQKVDDTSLVRFFIQNGEAVNTDEKKVQFASILMNLLGFL